MNILKDPAEYAAQIKDCYLHPTIVKIVAELARNQRQLPIGYVEQVGVELHKLGVPTHDAARI